MSKSILIVEDSSTDIYILEAIIKRSGIATHHGTVRNGEAVLVYLREADTLPDIILLDNYMPVMSGTEFVREFREQFGNKLNCGIVPFVTTEADQALYAEWQGLILDYVVKPLTVEKLRSLVTKGSPVSQEQ